MERYRAGVIGATGVVGQRLLSLLEAHPWFDATVLAGSGRSAERLYGDVVRWTLAGDPPARFAAARVHPAVPEAFDDCDLVFSALSADVAREIEPVLADRGLVVVSNSSPLRLAADVPLLVPEVNASHLSLLEAQRRRTGGGYVVTNPNCSVAGLALALAPLHRSFAVRRAVVVTLQAISGAGTDGPRALDLNGNVIPFIAGEEEKLETELAKILDDDRIRIAAHCHRVPVDDGHLASLSVDLATEASPEDAVEALRSFRGEAAADVLPTAPARPIVVRHEADRPQPRRDRNEGDGMSVVVGRVRRCPVFTLRLEVLSHNTIRGAAGAAILNAELLAARGFLPRRGRR